MFSYVNNNVFIVATAKGDVTGDGIPDNIYLTATPMPDSPYLQNITLVVQDGAIGRVTQVRPHENAGYNPTLFLGDFTGNGVNDILIIIQSGGSGAFTYDYVYSFYQNNPVLLFDFDVYNNHYKYKITYKDNYLVEVKSLNNNTVYLISILYKGKEYLNEIYDSNGKLKNDISGFVNGVSSLFPVDVDSDNVYELLAFQKVAGRNNADGLGYIQNVLKWNGKSFSLFEQFLAIYGKKV